MGSVGSCASPWKRDGRPALDACTNAACEEYVAEVDGYVSRPSVSGARLELSDLPEGDPARARDALQRRVRAVEVTLVVRSQRRDEKQVVRLADGTFALDAEGLPRDGFRRRRTALVLTPRNLLVAGGVAAAEAP